MDLLVVPMKIWAIYSYVESKSVLGDKVEHMMTKIFIYYLYFAKLVGFTQ